MTLISRPLLAPALSGVPAPVTRPGRQSNDILITRSRRSEATATSPESDSPNAPATSLEAVLADLLRRDADRAAALFRVEAGIHDLLEQVANLAARLEVTTP